MKYQKNIYPSKTIHEKSRRIIYKFSYKMGVFNEKRCKSLFVKIVKDNSIVFYNARLQAIAACPRV